VLILLHASLDQDELYHWRAELGGDAVGEMLLRYGWPSLAAWLGSGADRSHNSYLQAFHTKESDPYSTAEYSVGRIHFLPSWSAVEAPFQARALDWQLNAPRGLGTEDGSSGHVWWPVEHSPSASIRLRQLREGQTVVLRRQTNVILATAIESRPEPSGWFQGVPTDTVHGLLLVSEGPGLVDTIANQSTLVGSRIVRFGTMRPRPIVVGLELSGESAPAVRAEWSRTRFGLIPPGALNTLDSGSVALSQPVLFAVSQGTPTPSSAREVLPLMLGSTEVRVGSRIGVFWEAYGVRPGDSVQFRVGIEPKSGPGVLRRIGAVLQITDAPNGGVAVAWRDPSEAVRSIPGPGSVSVFPRSLVLNLSQLGAGEYRLQVSIVVSGRTTARSERDISISAF
jgi:hypothetical protein